MEKADKTLVAYASKSGATEEAANTIADILKEKYKFEVDIVNLRKEKPNLAQYKNIVVGSGVRMNKVYSEALKFMQQNFENRKVAFFICCGGAGDPKKYDESCEKYITNVLANYPNFKPVATEAFGGRMKILGKKLFDNIDFVKIRAWAESIGKKFVKYDKN